MSEVLHGVFKRRDRLVLAHAAGYLRVMWACGLFFFLLLVVLAVLLDQVWVSSVITVQGSLLGERGS